MAWLQVNPKDRIINLKNICDNVDIAPFFQFKENQVIVPQCMLFDTNWNLIEEVYEFLENRRLVKRQRLNTIESKGRALKIFYDFLEEFKINFRCVTPRVINDFIGWLFQDNSNLSTDKTTERTAKSVNTYISHVRDFYHYHSIINHVKNPFDGEMDRVNHPSNMPKGFFYHTLSSGKVGKSAWTIKERGKKPITILGKNEIQSLLQACVLERDKLMIKLLMFTGMRIGELLNLKVQAIGVPDNCEAQQLKMISSAKDDNRRQLKTGERTVYIPTNLMEELDTYYTKRWLCLVDDNNLDHDYFFISERGKNKGKPLTYSGVRNIFYKLFVKTRIKAMPHDFRHTYATNLARLKTDIVVLAEFLGHKNTHTVGIYIKMAEMEDVAKILKDFYEKFELGV